MTTEINTPSSSEIVELSPSYKIPWFLIIAAIPLSLIQVWLAGAIALFGLFLMVQTATIRLQFTATALDIYREGRWGFPSLSNRGRRIDRSQTLIRNFPYSEWLKARIFWQPVPILFYFREVNSIHFLPIIFSPQMLSDCLQKHSLLQE